MKAIPLARYLTDFTPKGPANASTPPAPLMRDHAEDRADALRQGRAEGLAEARAEFEALQWQSDAQFESRLAAERQAWAAGEGAALAAGITAGLQQIETDIAASVSRLLIPVLVQDARQKTIDHLTAALLQIRSRKPGIAFRIRGPQDLLDAMQAALGGDIAAEYQVSEGAELHVEADGALIETCLGAWRAKLDEFA
ncbi:hypothetical protein BH10PSE7_BH10PSE7_30870 [soil metagenome]